MTRSSGLFHGTTDPPAKGESLEPARKRENINPKSGLPVHIDEATGKAVNNYDVVHATNNESAAWKWASQRANNWEDRPRPSVLRVTPHPEMVEANRSPWGSSTASRKHLIAPEFKVEEQIDIKPGHQGTLPINWNQFAKYGGSDGYANHPSPEHEQRKKEDLLHEAYAKNTMVPPLRQGVPGQMKFGDTP